MKPIFFAALLLVAPCSHAQWGGFLNPEIMRKAGEDAATGNVNLNNVNMDGNRNAPQEQAMPTAQEIATAIRMQEYDAQQNRKAAERQAQHARVAAKIERAYNAEFRK